jgi:hypothetical protein
MQLYRALNTLNDWLYVGSAASLLATLHLLLYPLFRGKNTIERTLTVSTAANKLTCFTFVVLEACHVLDLASAIRALRSFFLATYMHDGLVLMVKQKDMQPWYGWHLLIHHMLALMLLVPYLSLWGSNPDIIHMRILGIWGLENLVSDGLCLYRLTYGIPSWWDAARLPRLLGLLLPVVAAYAYALAEGPRLSVLGWTLPSYYIAVLGFLMPIYNLYEQYRSWSKRRQHVAGKSNGCGGSCCIGKGTSQLPRDTAVDQGSTS